MATKKGDLISGAIGSVVFRVVDGKQIVCSLPAKGKVKQSQATKNSNTTFGVASTLAARIRDTMEGELLGKYDSGMCSRLSGKVFLSLKDCKDTETLQYDLRERCFNRLDSFPFNEKAQVSNYITEMPEVVLDNGMLAVKFKKMKILNQIKFPYRSYHCRLSVSVSLMQLSAGKMSIKAETQRKGISRAENDLEPFVFNFTVPDGCFYVVSLFLEYLSNAKNITAALTQKKLNPCCICKAAIAPGIYQGTDHFRWEEMISI